MRDKYETVFGGIDTRDSTTPPTWYRSAVDAPQGNSATFPSFSEATQTLAAEFGIEQVTTGYKDPETGEWVADSRYGALINPAWTGDARADAPQDTALWHIATDDYTATNATDNYGPLVAAARRAEYPDVYGTVETYRNGGEVIAEVLFDSLRFESEDGEAEFVLGFETGYGYYGRQSVWASLMARDVNTGAALRGLSDKFSSPHRGDVTERLSAWFDTMLERVEKLGDTLYEVVAEARNYTVEMNANPLSVAEFYESLGFPASWSRTAAENVHNPRTPSAFELYLPIAEAVTESVGGKKNGDALRNHASRANSLLFSPPAAERTALEAARDELAGQATLTDGEETAAERLTERIDSLDDDVAAFKSVRERVRTMLSEIDADSEADDAATDEPTDEQDTDTPEADL